MGVSADSRKGARMGADSLLLLVPDCQPVTVKIEDLDPIPAAVEEEEEMAGQEVLAEAPLDQSGKAVKPFAHVGRPGAKEHADGRGELREHQSPPRPSPPSRPAARMAMRSNSGSTAPLSRTIEALASSISSCPAAPASRIETGRKAGAEAPFASGMVRADGLSGSSGEAGAASLKRRFQA